MTHRLVYSAIARADLYRIYDWIADEADPDTALAYTSRIEAACLSLTSFPRRGTPRDDILPGLRTISFERKDVIAYTVGKDTVRIVAVVHHGRDLGRAFREDDPPSQ